MAFRLLDPMLSPTATQRVNISYFKFPTCGLVVGDLGFPMETEVQFPLMSYWSGYLTMMVTNPLRWGRS
ncbi:hypothetical protein Hanom_Chr03g00260971 [Helianthus anomalus]